MRRILALLMACLFWSTGSIAWADKSIAVFVALADNQNQGIVRVSAALGNGEDPEKNLYWGSGEGCKTVFDRSPDWKLTAKQDTPDGDILRTRSYQHLTAKATLSARAYRGKAIKQCLVDFETAVREGKYDLIAYVGHNGLMDFELPVSKRTDPKAKRPDVIVLCCKSETYFKDRLTAAGGRPVLLTAQLMYPGSFLVEAAAKEWLANGTAVTIRDQAAEAYAENQKITKKAALGIFAQGVN